MLMLAVPMVVLFVISEVIARVLDRPAAAARDSPELWADDEASPL